MLKINVKYQLKNTLIRINIDDTEPKFMQFVVRLALVKLLF